MASLSYRDPVSGQFSVLSGLGGVPDTGWRDITSLLTGGWVIQAGYPTRIRRIGNHVSLSGLVTNPANKAGNVEMLTLPAGFVSPYRCFWSGPTYQYAAFGWTTSPGAVRNGPAYTTGAGFWVSFGEITWITDEPWPSTLPGTPL